MSTVFKLEFDFLFNVKKSNDYQIRDTCSCIKVKRMSYYFYSLCILQSVLQCTPCKTHNKGVLYIDIVKQDGFIPLPTVLTNISMINIDTMCSLNTIQI